MDEPLLSRSSLRFATRWVREAATRTAHHDTAPGVRANAPRRPFAHRIRQTIELIGELSDHIASGSLFVVRLEDRLEFVEQRFGARKLGSNRASLRGRWATLETLCSFTSCHHHVAPLAATFQETPVVHS
jgi:hypothetical protein